VTDTLPAAEFAAAMEHCRAQGAPWPGAVAVSGGADSRALMIFLRDWAVAQGLAAPVVLTVDHGLSPESGRIAKSVVSDAKRLGLKAHRLVWAGDKPGADIEAAARTARYGLLGAWCLRHRVRGLYVAHTREDQAETFLLRLARGSGLDGLSAMRVCAPFPQPGHEGLCVVRPLLGIGRARLRASLEAWGEGWSEDPMNADPRFARVRIRKAWRLLGELGLTPERLAQASAHLARARSALDAATTDLVDAACQIHTDRILVDGQRLAAAPEEIALRALAQILSRVSGEAYRPRFERLERLWQAIRTGTFTAARTLHGCRIGRAPKADAAFGPATLVVTREPARRATRQATKKTVAKKIAARGQIS
jgi:tRNA(Ile)-lysidine synthase